MLFALRPESKSAEKQKEQINHLLKWFKRKGLENVHKLFLREVR